MRISFAFFNVFLIILGIITVLCWMLQVAFMISNQPIDHIALTLVNAFFTIIWLWLAFWSQKYQEDVRKYNRKHK